MIYELLKHSLNIENPQEYIEKIHDLESDIRKLRQDFYEKWTYCTGCQGYVEVNDCHEETLEDGRQVVKCNKCGRIWKYVNQDREYWKDEETFF